VLTQNLRQAPVSIDEQDLQKIIGCGRDPLVQRPLPGNIMASQPEQKPRQKPVAAAMAPQCQARAGDETLPGGSIAWAMAAPREPSSIPAFIVAASGLGVVASLWLVIIL